MKFSCIILAGRRKGKILVEKSVLETTIDSVLKFNPEKTVVVVCEELRNLNVKENVEIVTISESSGILSSLKAGIRKLLESNTQWILVYLGNQPNVEKEVVEKLISVCPSIMAIPVFKGFLGHPFLFSKKGAEMILNYPDEKTMRDFIEENNVILVEVNTPSVLERISADEDYLLQIKKFKFYE